MFMKVQSPLLLLTVIIFLNSCAKRGTPDGGPKDENPPEIVREFPITILFILMMIRLEFFLMNT